MSQKFTNKKKIIIIIIIMLVVIAALTVVIILINNRDDKSGDTGNDIDITPTQATTSTTDTPEPSAEPTKNPTAIPSEEGKKEESNSSNSAQGTEAGNDSKTVSVTLGEYKGLAAKYEPKLITDEYIDNILEQMQEYYVSVVDLPDRAFKEGDMAIVTFQADCEGKEIKELSGNYLQIVIGDGVMGKVIEDSIIGKKIGDTFECNVDYPENYTNVPAVAGKTVHFTIWLKDGFEFETPEINDEFIQTYSQYSSVEEYRIKEKERLQNEENEKATENLHKELKNKVIENCTFTGPIDDEITKAYVLRLQSDDAKYKEEYYVDAATFYAMTYDMTREEYQKSVRDEVTMDVKFCYVAEEIMKKENLSSLEEVEKLIYDTAVITN